MLYLRGTLSVSSHRLRMLARHATRTTHWEPTPAPKKVQIALCQILSTADKELNILTAVAAVRVSMRVGSCMHGPRHSQNLVHQPGCRLQPPTVHSWLCCQRCGTAPTATTGVSKGDRLNQIHYQPFESQPFQSLLNFRELWGTPSKTPNPIEYSPLFAVPTLNFGTSRGWGLNLGTGPDGSFIYAALSFPMKPLKFESAWPQFPTA